MGALQILGWHANRQRGQLRLVDASAVVEHGRQPATAHIVADSLDNLQRRQRLAKDLDGAAPPLFADDVTARAEPLAQFGECTARIVAPRVDPGDI
jgi:hypothetical protein